MLLPEEIAEQQQLLATHRHTLAIYLRQEAMVGRAYSPPALINGIEEARSNIRRIKTVLRAANVVVPDDPDDEPPADPPPRPVTLPMLHGSPLVWPRLATIGSIALLLAIGGWWLYSQAADTAFPPEAPLAEATPSTPEEPAPTQETPLTEADLAALESQLADANIALSAGQAEQVRQSINDPGTGYKLLAEHTLQIIGDQKFRDTLYLDELDTRYNNLVGQDHYFEFNEEHLKEAMVRAWNDQYTDRQAETFEEIVESRS